MRLSSSEYDMYERWYSKPLWQRMLIETVGSLLLAVLARLFDSNR